MVFAFISDRAVFGETKCETVSCRVVSDFMDVESFSMFADVGRKHAVLPMMTGLWAMVLNGYGSHSEIFKETEINSLIPLFIALRSART